MFRLLTYILTPKPGHYDRTSCPKINWVLQLISFKNWKLARQFTTASIDKRMWSAKIWWGQLKPCPMCILDCQTDKVSLQCVPHCAASDCQPGWLLYNSWHTDKVCPQSVWDFKAAAPWPQQMPHGTLIRFCSTVYHTVLLQVSSTGEHIITNATLVTILLRLSTFFLQVVQCYGLSPRCMILCFSSGHQLYWMLYYRCNKGKFSPQCVWDCVVSHCQCE